MEKSKSFSDLRKDFLRCNKERRKKVALREGFSEPELYLQYLERMQKSEIGAFKEKYQKVIKNLKKPVVHLVDILDVSGSMAGSKIHNALEGINSSLKELSKDIDYTYTLVTFSYCYKITEHHFMSKDIPKEVYESANGFTALYDAIGKTLSKLKDKVKPGEKILVNIYTDGEENSSIVFTDKDVKKLIESMKEYCTTTFIGTEYGVENVIKTLSIESSNTLAYDGTAEGLKTGMTTNSLSRQAFYSSVSKGEDVTKNFYKKLKNE